MHGRGRERPAGTPWPAPSGPCRTVRSSWSTAWSPRRSPRWWRRPCRRLRLVVLMHMPLGVEPTELGSVRSARWCGPLPSVVTTSRWSRDWLLASYGLDPGRVHVAHPGVDPSNPATGTRDGGALLCVGAVTPGKGHDLLLAALEHVADLPWRCTCVGSLSVAPDFVAQLRRRARESGLDDRFVLTGPLSGSRARSGVRRGRRARARQPGARPTAWSSPRRSPGGSRSSRPTWAVSRRRSASPQTAPAPGCSCLPVMSRRSPRHCGSG